MKKSQVGIGVFLISISFFVLIYGWKVFPDARGDDIGTKFFPFILAIILILLAIFYILQSLRSKSSADGGFKFSVRSKEALRVIVTILCCIIFIGLVGKLGFIIVSAIVLFLMMYILGYKKWFVMTGVAILSPTIIQLFFEKILSVMLPHGFLI